MNNWYLYFVQYWLGIGASCGDIPGHVSVFWKGTPQLKKGHIKRSTVVNGKKSLSWLEVVTVELGGRKKMKQKAVCGACARSFPFYKTSTLCRVGKCWPCTCHFMQWPTDCSSSVIMQGKLLAKECGTWKAGKCVWHAGVMSTNDGKRPGVSLVFAWGLSKRCTSPQHSTYEQSKLAPPNQFFFKHAKGYWGGFATQQPAFAAFFSSSLTKHMCIQTLFSPLISFWNLYIL